MTACIKPTLPSEITSEVFGPFECPLQRLDARARETGLWVVGGVRQVDLSLRDRLKAVTALQRKVDSRRTGLIGGCLPFDVSTSKRRRETLALRFRNHAMTASPRYP